MQFDMNMLAYCGLYCELCSFRAAFAEQNVRHLENVPARYKKERHDLAEYDCGGCKGRNICGTCRLRDCASAKALDSCADCADFPCAMLQEFGNDGAPHHHQALENLRTIRRDGIEAWYTELKPALYCQCGQRQSWYCLCPEHRRQ